MSQESHTKQHKVNQSKASQCQRNTQCQVAVLAAPAPVSTHDGWVAGAHASRAQCGSVVAQRQEVHDLSDDLACRGPHEQPTTEAPVGCTNRLHGTPCGGKLFLRTRARVPRGRDKPSLSKSCPSCHRECKICAQAAGLCERNAMHGRAVRVCPGCAVRVCHGCAPNLVGSTDKSEGGQYVCNDP